LFASHQAIKASRAKAGIGAQHDLHARPAGADLADDARAISSTAAVSRGNVVLFCGGGNHARTRGTTLVELRGFEL
jgi:hypothetical protein